MARPKARESSSLITVIFAFVADILIAIAKTIVAGLSGSASMVAEAAHSWSDTGNEIFLLLAERRSVRPPTPEHPLGFGRTAYVWAMFAGFGLFVAGSVVSITHGINALQRPEADSDYGLAYLVLAFSFLLEGASFVQSLVQARAAARKAGIGTFRYILRTSRTTVRSVFLEDLTAEIGILIAAAAMLAHQLTGNAAYDAIGSIVVGVMLGVTATVVIARNAQFLIGVPGNQELRDQILNRLLDDPEVASVSMLFLEFTGPGKVLVVVAVDLAGDAAEPDLARRVQRIEDDITGLDEVSRCLVTLSSPSDPGVD